MQQIFAVQIIRRWISCSRSKRRLEINYNTKWPLVVSVFDYEEWGRKRINGRKSDDSLDPTWGLLDLVDIQEKQVENFEFGWSWCDIFKRRCTVTVGYIRDISSQ